MVENYWTKEQCVIATRWKIIKSFNTALWALMLQIWGSYYILDLDKLNLIGIQTINANEHIGNAPLIFTKLRLHDVTS